MDVGLDRAYRRGDEDKAGDGVAGVRGGERCYLLDTRRGSPSGAQTWIIKHKTQQPASDTHRHPLSFLSSRLDCFSDRRIYEDIIII